MSKSQETRNKKDLEIKRKKKRESKEQKREERKSKATDGSLDSMIAYVDENGNFSSTPPDPLKKKRIIAEQIEVGVPRRIATEETNEARMGVVTFFNTSKGFGFIKDTKSQESIFTHINSHIDQIKEGDKVTFSVEQGPKGLNAVEVKLTK
jgi:cold shock CspA family protein